MSTQYDPLSANSPTNPFYTSATGGGGSNPAAGATGAAVPADASYDGVNVSGNLTGVTGKTAGGATGECTDINSVGGTALTLGQALAASCVPVVLPAAQITSLSSVTANAGTNLNTSALALETGGNLATIAGAVSASKMQVSGAVTVATATSGGASAFSYIAAASANQDQQSVKASAGTLYSVVVTNQNAALRYLKIYNASAPTSGSTPVFRIVIPASATGGGVAFPIPSQGVAFGTAIGIRITTGQADNDANAVTAGDVVVNIVYA